jgi:hypothetical protein
MTNEETKCAFSLAATIDIKLRAEEANLRSRNSHAFGPKKARRDLGSNTMQ